MRQKHHAANLQQIFILILFLFSGTSALIYQTVWIRQFGLFFGVDVYSTATVLTAFMAGLALGNLIFGQMVDRRKSALKLFMILELGIGLFALFFPFSIRLLYFIYSGLYRFLPTGFYFTQLYRFLLVFIFLLLPTTLMGGTLPVLTKVFVKELNSLGKQVGRLYSINNFGALIGCFLAGFFLMRAIGLNNTIFLAASLNILNAAIVFLISKMWSTKTIKTEIAQKSNLHTIELPRKVLIVVLWAFALEGFTTLAFEVIWTRILLGFSYDKSVYFYSTVILSFIFGLSFGSYLIAKIIDKLKNLMTLFAALEVMIGVLAIVLLSAFSAAADILDQWRLNYNESWWTSLGKEYLLFFLIMIVPTTLMGMTFPVVSKICTFQLKKLGTRIGQIGFLDTVGSIFGAFFAGFIFIPFFGVVKAVFVTALLNCFIGISIFLINPFTLKKKKLFYTSVSLLIICALIFTFPSSRYFYHWQTKMSGDRLLFYHEGADATIAVPQHINGVKFLSINGSVTAFANYGDTRVHKMLGYLPYFLHDNPKQAIVIGLGMGITAQSLMQPEIKQVDCVELSKGVVKACTGFFNDVNKDVMNEPRLNIIVNDGRSYLQMTEKKYDIITSNAVHARLSANLYTKDFYQLCKDRLHKNGVMCQWTSTNWLTVEEFKSLITAFQSVFPHSSLWMVNAGHVLLIGTPDALHINYDKLDSRMQNSKVQADLLPYSLGTPELFLAHFVSDDARLSLLVHNVDPMTDDFPRAEFSRVVSKMQIPEIILNLIHIKHDLSDRLVFKRTNLLEAELIRRKIASYSKAEKYYLEGVYAQNFYNEPFLALNMLTNALELQPNDYRYHEEAGSINLQLAQRPNISDEESATFLDNAISHLENMTSYFPTFAFDWNNLGYLYMNRGNLDKAENAFLQAIHLAPQNPMARIYMASLYGGRKDYDAAVNELLTVIKNYPDLTEAYYRLGLVYELMNRSDDAQKTYQSCLQVEKNYKDAQQRLERLEKL